jgi:hypothetical protein
MKGLTSREQSSGPVHRPAESACGAVAELARFFFVCWLERSIS